MVMWVVLETQEANVLVVAVLPLHGEMGERVQYIKRLAVTQQAMGPVVEGAAALVLRRLHSRMAETERAVIVLLNTTDKTWRPHLD
jgi:hypothetical protein